MTVSRVADRHLGLVLVFMVVCVLALVVVMAVCIMASMEEEGMVWVLKSAVVEMASVVWMLMFMVVIASVWVSASPRRTAP